MALSIRPDALLKPRKFCTVGSFRAFSKGLSWPGLQAKFRTGEATAADAGRNREPAGPSLAIRHPPRFRRRCFAGWGRGALFSALQPLIADRAKMLIDAKHDQDELRNDARKHDSDEHPSDA
jgi:hypothetical protein